MKSFGNKNSGPPLYKWGGNTMEEVVESAPEIVEAPIVEQAVTTENAAPNVEVVETKPEKTFTQAELNDIITKRIERERESVTKKVAQEARDSYIAEQNLSWNGKPITTEAEYRDAEREQELIDSYREKKLPDDVVKELVENKKFREKYEKDQQTSAEKSKIESDFEDFAKTFPDAKPDEIPLSVWADVNNGKSLVDAYTKFENQTLRDKLAAVEQQKQIEQQNIENAASSTGSVTGQGGVDVSFITADTFEKNRNDAGWVKKNFDKIMESRNKW